MPFQSHSYMHKVVIIYGLTARPLTCSPLLSFHFSLFFRPATVQTIALLLFHIPSLSQILQISSFKFLRKISGEVYYSPNFISNSYFKCKLQKAKAQNIRHRPIKLIYILMALFLNGRSHRAIWPPHHFTPSFLSLPHHLLSLPGPG